MSGMRSDVCTGYMWLIWYTLDPVKLSENAAAACAKIPTKGAFVSSISIWEIGIKIKEGKLEIGTSLEDFLTVCRIAFGACVGCHGQKRGSGDHQQSLHTSLPQLACMSTRHRQQDATQKCK